MARSLQCLVVFAILTLLSGCYLTQAAQGHLALMAKREPIAKVIAKPNTDARLRTRLQLLTAAREFAVRELALPDNQSYRSYADIKRNAVVWNVFATDRFSVAPRQWCFPIAGCVVYRGYFAEKAAQRYARRIRLRGGDASVAGAAAYSTLGHFDDPVVSTMMRWSDAQLIATLFHELAHQVVYVPGDSVFNESFASVVEEVGIERWLDTHGDTAALLDWRAAQRRGAEFSKLLLQTRANLLALYNSNLEPQTMARHKQLEFGRLKFAYQQLKANWNGFNGYDAWFNRALSNADLVPIATYDACVPALKRLLQSVNNDWRRFYVAVGELAKGSAAKRTELCAEH